MFLIKLGKQTSKMAIKRNEIMKDLKLSEKCGGILILIICLIRASAADVQAGSSPIGYVDNIDYNGTVYGWAKDPDAPNAAITVEVWADNTILCGTAVASWYHDSVAGSHGFTFTLPENIRSSTPPLPPAGLHSIYVYGLDSVGGDPKALIQNGNPFPTPLNVSSNDNSWLHTTGGSYQIGPSSSNLVGGRPNNKLSAVAAKSLLSAAWQGMGLPWFKEGYGKITVTAAPRVGGAISSIMWDNVEFLDSGGHGAALQYIEHDSTTSELYNPTEAGSAADDAFAWYSQSIINLNPLNSTQNPPDPISYSHIYQHGSSSALQTLTKTSTTLHTISRMAFYIPKNPVPVYNGLYPKPANTIYSQSLCQSPSPVPSPPGRNANDAFYSIYDLNQNATNATHSIAAPDVLPSLYYEGTEPISDYTLDKTIKFGVANHPNLKNVLVFDASITLPAGSAPHDVQLVAYPDHVRFRSESASRTLTYDPGPPATESDVTSSSSGAPLSGAVIAVSRENRYAIALYCRQAKVGQYFIQGPHGQSTSHIVLGTGTNGTLTAGAAFTLHSYVIVGTLHDVEASINELSSINPPP